MSSEIKKLIGNAFLEIADAVEMGRFGGRIRIGLTTLSSEHGVANLVKGAELASRDADYEIVLIGPKVPTKLKIYPAETEAAMHKKMEELLDAKEIDACVTMHYSFPIGVSTVGRVITPGTGKEMYLATTSGTSALERTTAMIKNAIYGIITAKTMGIAHPTVGILNVDQAHAVERALLALKQKGYPIFFGESARKDGGRIMRGNDLLTGAVDVMVTDTLTGNVLMKMFSSFTTGGDYECLGYGYGPGLGFDYDRNILILSRASGVPVVANALKYAAGLAKGQLNKVATQEFEQVRRAGLDEILFGLSKEFSSLKHLSLQDELYMRPEKEVVTVTVSGIDIINLEEAVKNLWKNGIYAEGGMGCTGPVIMVSDKNLENAIKLLKYSGYIVR